MKRLKHNSYKHLVPLLILTGLLSACGGGSSNSGGGSNTAPATSATLSLAFSSVKQFNFSWSDVSDATHYKLMENPDGASGYSQIGSDVIQGVEQFSLTANLTQRTNASYILQSCNSQGCIDSSALNVTGAMADAVGYFKASNSERDDWFGQAISLSADGNTLAISATGEDSQAIGINGDQNDNSGNASGAVYVFIQDHGNWAQQAYIKASNAQDGDNFGHSVSLSADGDTLAVGAIYEDSNATGIGVNANDNSANNSGAVYVFNRSINTWNQQVYIKASNTGAGDYFGYSVSLSADGNTLAVGASGEDSGAVDVDGNEDDNSAIASGAAYLFTRSGSSWSQQAYLKASNTDTGDTFGRTLSLSGDGNTLAVSAFKERSNATGIDGNQNDNSNVDSGAVYVFNQNSGTWSQQAYLKASNSEANDRFGLTMAINNDGTTLAVGTQFENSNATGINGDESNNDATYTGAVYLFKRNSNLWTQSVYIKASNTETNDEFGSAVSLSGDGNSLAVAAIYEDSNATGVSGDQSDNTAFDSGAVYLY